MFLQIASYGGYLRASLVYNVAQDDGVSVPDVDVEIIVSTTYRRHAGGGGWEGRPNYSNSVPRVRQGFLGARFKQGPST